MKIGMNRPHLFKVATDIQRKANLKLIEENAYRMRWKKTGDTAIDVGCGDGSLTSAVKNFKPFENHYYKNFVAADLNENMLKYAKEHYGDDNMTFKQLNIDDQVPEDFKGGFNHVFCFKVLQYVKDEEKVFKNLYDLMTDDGDMIVTIVKDTEIYTIYDILSKQRKWRTWLKDIKSNFLSPYYGIKNPEKKARDLLIKGGFKDFDIQFKPFSYDYDYKDLKVMVQSVEPFNMPDEVFDELFVDYMSIGKEYDIIKIKNINNERMFGFNYTLLVIFAKK